ncbi:hypothetical protein [Salipiger abyssi]|uniref:Uncharacterized protein n=1 Tax=Salipiger abyssi TaxID=1250539 RepID=A0A1P8UPE8_9RHOB|nr:hypothetical protein [Salipiger abyssi]APZ51245.1 hypothetical protein Ga0080574_TMP911 [Salipiger abyssi]
MNGRKSPRVAFGLQAATVALKAKAGVLTGRDQIVLVEAMFDWVDDDPFARDAVRDFFAAVRIDAARAGDRLLSWLDNWLPEMDFRRPEGVLRGIEAERIHDWCARKDCGLE